MIKLRSNSVGLRHGPCSLEMLSRACTFGCMSMEGKDEDHTSRKQGLDIIFKSESVDPGHLGQHTLQYHLGHCRFVLQG